jgi:hypothetical protein
MKPKCTLLRQWSSTEQNRSLKHSHVSGKDEQYDPLAVARGILWAAAVAISLWTLLGWALSAQ